MLLQIRDQLKIFVAEHEVWSQRVGVGLLAFVCLNVINHAYGYSSILSHIWLIALLSLMSAFMPVNGAALVMIAYLLVHLTGLSMDVALMGLLLIVVSYLICSFYQSRDLKNIILISVFQQWNIPYVMPVYSGLLGGVNEVASVVCGGVVAFYLRTVRENSSMFLDETASVSAVDLVLNQMLGNHFFYFYMIALVAMFLVIYEVKCRDMKNAWLRAVIFGLLTEFVIMLTGYLFTGVLDKAISLIIGNLIVFVFGFIMDFFLRGLDYSRVEKVQFEDDDYYYYVTAVPKIHVTEERVQVKKITDEPVHGQDKE